MLSYGLDERIHESASGSLSTSSSYGESNTYKSTPGSKTNLNNNNMMWDSNVDDLLGLPQDEFGDGSDFDEFNKEWYEGVFPGKGADYHKERR